MTLPSIILSNGLSILFLVVLFRPLEKLFPAREGQKFMRPAFWMDLCFLLGQYLLWSGLVFWALNHFRGWLDGFVPPNFLAAVAAQSWWLQAIEMIVLSDFIIYWAHRLQHAVPFLWRFHSIHHSAEHLDWLAAHREHPLDRLGQSQDPSSWFTSRAAPASRPLGPQGKRPRQNQAAPSKPSPPRFPARISPRSSRNSRR
jgi:sterol desaturase/sphingolipid hydroxylase (fatty acid hydroxylase superfamily)